MEERCVLGVVIQSGTFLFHGAVATTWGAVCWSDHGRYIPYWYSESSSTAISVCERRDMAKKKIVLRSVTTRDEGIDKTEDPNQL